MAVKTKKEKQYEATDKHIRMFKRLVEIKRNQADLKDEYDGIKEYFKGVSSDVYGEEGEGTLIIWQDHGVKFKKRKSSISKKKLLEAGIEADLIEDCRGEYLGFDVV